MCECMCQSLYGKVIHWWFTQSIGFSIIFIRSLFRKDLKKKFRMKTIFHSIYGQRSIKHSEKNAFSGKAEQKTE